MNDLKINNAIETIIKHLETNDYALISSLSKEDPQWFSIFGPMTSRMVLIKLCPYWMETKPIRSLDEIDNIELSGVVGIIPDFSSTIWCFSEAVMATIMRLST